MNGNEESRNQTVPDRPGQAREGGVASVWERCRQAKEGHMVGEMTADKGTRGGGVHSKSQLRFGMWKPARSEAHRRCGPRMRQEMGKWAAKKKVWTT